MTFINLNKQCGAHIELRTIYGMTIKTYQCILLEGHPGPHRDADGSVFVNSEGLTNHVRQD